MGRTMAPNQNQYGGVAKDAPVKHWYDYDTGPDGARITAKGDPNDPGSVVAGAVPTIAAGVVGGAAGGPAGAAIGAGAMRLFQLGMDAEGRAIDERSAGYARQHGTQIDPNGGGTGTYWTPDGTATAGGATGTGGGMGGDTVTGAIDKQTMLNRPNQVSPSGTTSWSPDGKTQTTAYAPLLGQTNDALQQQALINALRGLPDGEAARNQAITGAYDQAASRLNPQWKQRDEQLASTLANQGLDPGSQAYRNAMLQQSQQRNDAYGGAMSNAIAQGTAAGNAIFQQGIQSQKLPFDLMGDMKELSRPFGFNGAASPNVLGEKQFDYLKSQDALRQKTDYTQAQWSNIVALANAGIPAAIRVLESLTSEDPSDDYTPTYDELTDDTW